MSYYDVDFERHPMPRSVVARIRERLAGKSGDAAASAHQTEQSVARITNGRGESLVADVASGPHLRCSREK